MGAVFVHASYPRYFYLLLGIAFALSSMFEDSEATELRMEPVRRSL
jgi:hypothetical protein